MRSQRYRVQNMIESGDDQLALEYGQIWQGIGAPCFSVGAMPKTITDENSTVDL